MQGKYPESVAVSVIIPVYNKMELTAACLHSLAQHMPKATFEVIVVDNCSTDATSVQCPALGQRLFGNFFSYLRQPINKNFAGACNLGAREAHGEYLFFLNNDTLATENWLDPLLDAFAKYPNIAAVGPLLLYPVLGAAKDRVQHAGVALNPVMQVLHLYEGLPANHRAVTHPRATQVITAAAMLMPKALFLSYNGFNEGYVNGCEDIDLCARLWAGGYSMLVEPAAKIYHLQSQTPGRHASEAKNSALLLKTTMPLLSPDMHVQLQMDGLEIGLSDWLAFYPKMPDQMTALLSARFLRANASKEQVASLLQQEPFWYEGYAWLAEQLENEQNWNEAFSWRLLAAKLKADPDTILPLLRLAPKVTEDAAISYYIRYINQSPFSSAFFINSTKRILQWSQDCGIDAVATQCTEWLRRQETFKQKTLLPAIRQMHEMGITRASLGNKSWISYYCQTELQKDFQEKEDIHTAERLKETPQKPLLSIVMPVYNPLPAHINAAVQSVRQQTYENWQLCIADDASSNPEIRDLLLEHARNDIRISVTFREKNGHICAASNTALAAVRGDYVILMDQDDLLTRSALAEVVLALAEHPDALLLFSDEDKINDLDVLSEVYYKPDFDPDLLCCQNYFSHLGVYKASLVQAVGGFREGFEGAQDHDLVLRCSEQARLNQIIHIPKVLYHWRLHSGSTAGDVEVKPYARKSAIRAVQEHFARTGRKAVVELPPQCSYYHVQDELPSPLPRISLLTTTERLDGATEQWAEQLLANTAYPHLEILVLHANEARWSNKNPRIQTLRLKGKNSLAPGLHAATGNIIGHVPVGLLPYEATWLDQIAAGLARPEVLIAGGRIFTEKNVLESAGLGITADGFIFPAFAGIQREKDDGYYYQHGLIRNVLLCANDSFFAKAPHFKSRYNEALGDLWAADLCMSAREDGFRVLCTPEADLYRPQDFPHSAQQGHDERALTLFTERWEQTLLRNALHPMLMPTYGGYCAKISGLL